MPTPIAAIDLPFAAQYGPATLTGDGIGPVMPRAVVGARPDRVLHLPRGQHLDVAPDSLIHLLCGQGEGEGVAWETRFSSQKARVDGPALVRVESAASASARLRTPLTATSYTLADRKRAVRRTGSITAGLGLFMGLLWALYPNYVSRLDADRLADAPEQAQRAAAGIAPFVKAQADWTLAIGLSAVLFFGLWFVCSLYALAFPSKGKRVSVFRPFPGALARRMGIDPTRRSEHQVPALSIASPNPVAALVDQAVGSPRLVAQKALPGVPAPVPADTLSFLAEGQVMAIPAGSVVSVWKVGKGASQTGIWHHTHVQSGGVLHGPALAGLRAGAAPNFRAFAGNRDRKCESGASDGGMLIMLLAVVFGGLYTLIGALMGTLVHVVVCVAIFASFWALGYMLRRLSHRHRAIRLQFA